MSARKRRTRRGSSGGSNDAAWLTVYNDMTTNLMLFFLLLYALSLMDGDSGKKAVESIEQAFSGMEAGPKGSAGSTTPRERARATADRLSKQLSTLTEQDVVTVNVTENEVRLTLPSEVLFDLGRSDLKPESEKILSRVGEKLRSTKSRILVYGHTDDVPIVPGHRFASNWELSLARAHSVVVFLSGSVGVPRSQLAVSGFGELRPLMPNDSPANRRRNRRIEIRIVET